MFEPHAPFGIVLVANAFGAMVNNPVVEIFLWTVMADLLTGIVKSFTKGAKIKADSSVGLKGLSKHLLIIVLALTVYPFLDVLEFDTVSNAVLLFYTAEYAISIVENLDVMGFPIPPFLKPKFEKLAKIAGKEDDDK